MFGFINDLKKSSNETKLFIFTATSIGIILIATTLFAFLRLDYVRSYPVSPASKIELNTGDK